MNMWVMFVNSGIISLRVILRCIFIFVLCIFVYVFYFYGDYGECEIMVNFFFL